MRLSRWGQSPYETDADIAAEAKALSALVQMLPPGEDAEIVVVHSKIRFGEAELEQAPSCRLVITTTSGTDHLDLQALEARGVAAARLPLARRDAVVETALMMMLWGLRATGPLQAAAQAGRWARAELPGMNMRLLGGRTVGLLGLGVIGARVAAVLGALGADVLGCDPRGLPEGVRSVGLPALLDCDVLSLHCDLNPTSAGIIGAAEISLARQGMVLVNTARGGLVDEAAALQALEEGRLGAVCLDVFAEEPWPGLSRSDSHPALMVLPHAAGFHTGLSGAVQAGLLAAVAAFCQGTPVRFRVS